MPDSLIGRRRFLQTAAAAPLICTIGGKEVVIDDLGDVERADRAAASVRKPRSAQVDRQQFTAPEPQPGGVKREYWIAARGPVRWNVAPTGRDEWMKDQIARPRSFRALVYQRYTAGFAQPIGPASIPGPTLEGEVGDTIVVHFRNSAPRFRQGLTIHPHGVNYNPEYDGTYLGDFTRAGGFVGPGEEFTYVWECRPDSVGVWPYHDHGPNHTLNTFRGLMGAIVVREKGTKRPDSEHVLMLHSIPPQVTGARTLFQAVNGRTRAGNTPTIRTRVGQDVAIHVMGFDSNYHNFHIHGHRWKDASGTWVDTGPVGPNETLTARFVEDNPGRWLYHCHVFTHQNAGMAGWYIVDQ
jgi:FtsP/CotA-like multicopper oxidase with cupredoxin domain